MAFTSLQQYLKPITQLEKRSDAALRKYPSSDARAWTSDKIGKSNLIHEIITTPTTRNNAREMQNELEKIHTLYKDTSKKVGVMEEAAKESQNLLRISQELIKQKDNEIEQVKSAKCEDNEKLAKECAALKEKLKKYDGIDEQMKKLKQRADDADRLEEQNCKLKKELCNFTAKTSKANIKQPSSCNQCQNNLENLQRLKEASACDEKKYSDIVAERNFLLQKIRNIDVLEAELILYKCKYEENECKILALKEMICKGEECERQLQQVRCQLREAECKLQAAENENSNLINVAERLECDLKESDIYIESLTRCMNETFAEIEESKISARAVKSISYESIASGTVQEIVKKISSGVVKTPCRSNVSNCKCGEMQASSSKTSQIFKRCTKKCSKKRLDRKSSGNISNYSKSQCDEIQKLLNEVRQLRERNCELEKEVERVKQEFLQMSQIVDEVENQRKSNDQLEHEIEGIRSSFNIELSQISSKYEMSMNEKMNDLNQLKAKLMNEIEHAREIEEKFNDACKELSTHKEYRQRCVSLESSLHCAQSAKADKEREAEFLKKDCQAYFEENQELKCLIECLRNEIEALNCRDSGTQREVIKQSVNNFKKQYDEKVQMIKCYEEKIRQLEKENKGLRCKSITDDCVTGSKDVIKNIPKFISSLDNHELVELYNFVRAILDPKTLPTENAPTCPKASVRKSRSRSSEFGSIKISFIDRKCNKLKSR